MQSFFGLETELKHRRLEHKRRIERTARAAEARQSHTRSRWALAEGLTKARALALAAWRGVTTSYHLSPAGMDGKRR